jgi:hypothetical protein
MACSGPPPAKLLGRRRALALRPTDRLCVFARLIFGPGNPARPGGSVNGLGLFSAPAVTWGALGQHSPVRQRPRPGECYTVTGRDLLRTGTVRKCQLRTHVPQRRDSALARACRRHAGRVQWRARARLLWQPCRSLMPSCAGRSTSLQPGSLQGAATGTVLRHR